MLLLQRGADFLLWSLWLMHPTDENGDDFDCCGVEKSNQHPNCLTINLPETDSFYSRFGRTCMEFKRSIAGQRPHCALGKGEAYVSLANITMRVQPQSSCALWANFLSPSCRTPCSRQHTDVSDRCQFCIRIGWHAVPQAARLQRRWALQRQVTSAISESRCIASFKVKVCCSAGHVKICLVSDEAANWFTVQQTSPY